MTKLWMYAVIFLGAFSVLSGGASFVLYGWWQDTKEKLAIVEAVREQAEKNLILVSDQLATERELRQAADITDQELRSVPDAEYNQDLSPAVGNVLRNFRDRMQ